MSEAGLLVKNNSNELLINNTYRNLYLFRKIKLTSLPYETISNVGLVFATDIQANEVIAPIARTSGGELTAFSIRAVKWMIYAPYTTQNNTESKLLTDLNNVYVYIFGINTSTTKTNNYGLQVFDENGVCVFNSNNKPLRVLHYANNVGDNDRTDASIDGYVVPSNKVCAIFNCAITRTASGTASRPVFFLNAYISASREVRQQSTRFGFSRFSFIMGDYIGYMIVDVTNY